jgi:hypothetical protein
MVLYIAVGTCEEKLPVATSLPAKAVTTEDTGNHRAERSRFLPVFLGTYNPVMQRKIFWLIVVILEVATFWLPLWYQVFAILPIVWIAWWVAYRSDWF